MEEPLAIRVETILSRTLRLEERVRMIRELYERATMDERYALIAVLAMDAITHRNIVKDYQ